MRTAYLLIFSFLRRLTIIFFFGAVLFFASAIAIMQIPVVQKSLVNLLTTSLESEIGYPIKVGYLSLNWIDDLLLKDVILKDHLGKDMIYIEEVHARFSLLTLIRKYKIEINKVSAVRPNVRLEYYYDIRDVNISDFIYRLKKMGKSGGASHENGPKKYVKFAINELKVENGTLSYDDWGIAKKTDRFDFMHFRLDSIYGEATRFGLIADTLSMTIAHMRCTDQFSKKKIERLDTRFGVCENYLKLDSLQLQWGNSYFTDRVHFRFDRLTQLSYIQDSVWIEIAARDSKISSQDMKIFFPEELSDLRHDWMVNGTIYGKFCDFKSKKLMVRFGDKSYFKGEVAMKGLPAWENTYIQAEIENSHTEASDIIPYGLQKFHKQVLKIPQMDWNGSFEGNPSTFRTRIEGNTSLGNLTLTGAFDLSKETYKAQLDLKKFRVDQVLDSVDIQEITGSILANGQHYDWNSLKINGTATVHQMTTPQLRLKNLQGNISIIDKTLHASLDIKDSSLTTETLLNYSEGMHTNTWNINSYIHKADLQKLSLYSAHKVLYRGQIKIEQVENRQGHTTLRVEALKNAFGDTKSETELESIYATYTDVDSSSEIRLESDALEMTVKGQFELKNLPISLEESFEEIKASFQTSDTLRNRKSYFRKNKRTHASLEAKFRFGKISPMLAVFHLPYRIAPKSWAEISLNTHHEKNNLYTRFLFNSDTLEYQGIAFENMHCALNGQKVPFQTTQTLQLTIDCQKISDKSQSWAENLHLQYKRVDRDSDFNFFIKQFQQNNQAGIYGKVRFDTHQNVLQIERSDIVLLDKSWEVAPSNQVLFKDKKLVFDQMILKADSQSISIHGNYSESEDDIMHVDIQNFEIENLSRLANTDLSGKLHASIVLKTHHQSKQITGQTALSNLKYNKLFIGNVQGYTKYEPEQNKLDLLLHLERYGQKIVRLSGPIFTFKDKPARMDLVAHFDKTNLAILEPFFTGILSQFGGTAQGAVKIQGNLQKPLTYGNVLVSDGSFKIDYLGTKYSFSDTLSISPQGVTFTNTPLQDGSRGKALIEGEILHDNYKNLRFNILGTVQNSKILQTLSTDNSLYFGTAKANGTFEIDGNLDQVNIKIDAISAADTKITIPLNSTSESEDYKFIQIKKKAVHGSRNEALQLPKESDIRFTMQFNFELTPLAQMDIIIDPVSGDKISGRGNGIIRMEIDTKGDFTMHGNYEFDRESFYYFTFLNTIHKKFNISKGSKLTFNGDPYDTQMDLLASYDDRVPLHTLVDTSLWKTPGIKNPYPVSTQLYLKGNVMKPVISYDIQIRDFPTAIGNVPMYSYVSSFLNRIRNNENEMNNQVFGLLVFRRFLAPGQGVDAGGTVSEMLSSQLNNIVSQIDRNLAVDVNLSSINRDALSSMQVRVSYTLMEGKVRITRSTPNSALSSSTANVIGDWSVEYMLTDDGKFRLKGFSRSNPNVLAGSNNTGNTNSTGVSLLHTAHFNTLNPFRKRKTSKSKSK